MEEKVKIFSRVQPESFFAENIIQEKYGSSDQLNCVHLHETSKFLFTYSYRGLMIFSSKTAGSRQQ